MAMAKAYATDFGDAEQLEREIAEHEAHLATDRVAAWWRDPETWLIGFAAILGVVIAVWGRVLVPGGLYSASYPIIGISFAAGSILFGLWTATLRTRDRTQRQRQLASLKARRAVIAKLNPAVVQEADGRDLVREMPYFDRLVTINVDNLAAYYSLVKEQTDKSFQVSVVVGVVGFVLIAVGLVAGFVVPAQDGPAIAYLATGSGVVTEFIAGIFFFLYNRTVAQMKGYHDSLLQVQNILLSFKIVGDTAEGVERTKMVADMLKYLVGQRAALVPAEQQGANT